MKSKIRIFIGTSNDGDSWIERAYVYSLVKHSSQPLDITFLRPRKFPEWKRYGWGTPFTNFRYLVPEICGFKGKALYTDVDQLNLSDIAELWETNLQGRPFGMVWDSMLWNGEKWDDTVLERGWWADSVVLFDCEKAKPHMKLREEMVKDPTVQKAIFFEELGQPYREKSVDFVKQISPVWNSFDGKNTSAVAPEGDRQPELPLEEIKHVHFTGLSTQPWHPYYSPYGKSTHERQDIMEVLWKYAEEATWIADPQIL